MMGFGSGFLWVGIYGLLAAIFAFEIWMFIDAFQNPRLSSNERLVWCIGMLLLHPLVAIVYYVVVHSNRSEA